MLFYKNHATAYAESTYQHDFAVTVFDSMSEHLKLNPINETLLDIGCGSGRDANHLVSLGYSVDAFDQSPEMIAEAKRLTGLDNIFNVGSASGFKSDKMYYFAYSIACLLHLNDDEFNHSVKHIMKHIHKGGYFYFTLKEGEGEELDAAGRYFNYYSTEKIKSACCNLGLDLIDIKKQADLTRPDVQWLYVLVQKP